MESPDSQHIVKRVPPDSSAEQCAEQHHTNIKRKKKLSAEQRVCTEFPYPSLDHRTSAVLSYSLVNTHKQNGDHKGRAACLIQSAQHISYDIYKIFHYSIILVSTLFRPGRRLRRI